jgi:hypothetical protein
VVEVKSNFQCRQIGCKSLIEENRESQMMESFVIHRKILGLKGDYVANFNAYKCAIGAC